MYQDYVNKISKSIASKLDQASAMDFHLLSFHFYYSIFALDYNSFCKFSTEYWEYILQTVEPKIICDKLLELYRLEEKKGEDSDFDIPFTEYQLVGDLFEKDEKLKNYIIQFSLTDALELLTVFSEEIEDFIGEHCLSYQDYIKNLPLAELKEYCLKRRCLYSDLEVASRNEKFLEWAKEEALQNEEVKFFLEDKGLN